MVYANVFRTYSVLDAHLLSMETQKLKKQQLEESHSSRSLVAKKEEEKGEKGEKEGEKKEEKGEKEGEKKEEKGEKEKEVVKKLVKKKAARKDSYCDVLQK